MKILMILNKPEREINIMKKIGTWILEFSSDSIVKIIEFNDRDFMIKIFEFKPDIIFTYPMTSFGLASYYYLFKFLLNCFVICFRTEGVMNYNFRSHIDLMAGRDKYGRNLVDYELFWGEKSAQLVGSRLLEQGKISSPERVKYFGYPEYEEYFNNEINQLLNYIPDNIKKKINLYPKKNIFFFVTGFSFANYSKQDILNAKDILNSNTSDTEKELEKALDAVERCKRFRDLWIEKIIETAIQEPEILIIVKSHPIENIIFKRNNFNPYKVFDNYNNILYISDVPVKYLLATCGVFFHYGSTTLAETYILNIPSVFVTSQELYDSGKKDPYLYFSDMGMISSVRIDIIDLPEFVQQYLRSPVKFVMTPELEKILSENFNIRKNQIYMPSKDIAKFLLDLKNDKPQEISATDPFLINAIKVFNSVLVNFLCQNSLNLYNKGDFSNALTYFDKALLISMLGGLEISNLKYMRANCFVKLGLLLSAEQCLANDYSLNQNSPDWINLMAEVKLQLGNRDEAKNILARLLDRWPEYKKAYINIGIIFFEENDFIKALENFIRALKLEPEDRDATIYCGKTLMKLEKPEEAERLFVNYLKSKNDEEMSLLLKEVKHNGQNIKVLLRPGQGLSLVKTKN